LRWECIGATMNYEGEWNFTPPRLKEGPTPLAMAASGLFQQK